MKTPLKIIAAAVFALAIESPAAPAGPELLAEKEAASQFDSEAFQEAVNKLHEQNIINDPDFWIANVRPGKFIDAGPVIEMLIAAANRFEKVESLDQALQVLGQNKVLPSYEKWGEDLTNKRKVAGGVAASLVMSLAKNLK